MVPVLNLPANLIWLEIFLSLIIFVIVFFFREEVFKVLNCNQRLSSVENSERLSPTRTNPA
jgi:hypothetical protein